jgi:hypothetical protein
MTPLGIESATFLLVAQSLDQLRHRLGYRRRTIPTSHGAQHVRNKQSGLYASLLMSAKSVTRNIKDKVLSSLQTELPRSV